VNIDGVSRRYFVSILALRERGQFAVSLQNLYFDVGFPARRP
jgi:hypothetical protein